MRGSLTLVLGALALSSGCFKTQAQPDLAGQDLRLTVLHTSDLHSRLLPYFQTAGLIDRGLGLCGELQPFGGAARLAHLVKRERAKGERVMHLDSGDCFQGAPIFNQFNGEAEVKVMSALRPDGVVVGNHEFDLGARNLAFQYGRFGDGAYPLLAANYIFSEPEDPFGHTLGALVKPYTLIDLEGLKVAIIGMGNTSSMTSLQNGGNSSGITPMEPVEALRSWVTALSPHVDLVLVVSHMGLTSRSEPNLAEDTEMITGYSRTVDEDALPACNYPDPQDCWQVLERTDDGQVRVWVPGVRGIDAIFGGHLHIVLNPPKVLFDPAGRPVLLVHSGAFAKFFGRADLVVRVPKRGEPAPWGAEIVSHTYEVFPITNRVPKKAAASVVACPEDGRPTTEVEEGLDEVGPGTPCQPPFGAAEQLRICKRADRCRQIGDACTDDCRRARRECQSVPAPIDGQMLEMLDPYVIELYQSVDLNRAFSYATEEINRFGTSGEDSPLGNLVADSMRLRNRVEAQFAMTNTLGIRTDMEGGLVSIEQMFNIFPFENTLTTIFLSGVEVQELFDYVTERSSERGCQTQAQISGIEFTMNCAQALRNLDAPACTVSADCTDTEWAKLGADKPVSCRIGHCYKSPADDIRIQGEPLNPTESYKAAVNDFIGRGGSGFEVLRRNTTKVNTGLSLRDALIDYMRAPPARTGGGPGRICGSPFLVEPVPAPTRPLRVFDKAQSADIDCDSRPAGCGGNGGRFVSCQETETQFRFFCIPNDFGTEEVLEDVAPLFERLTLPEGRGSPCEQRLDRECQGQLHCVESTNDDGSVEGRFYCMVPLCVDPPRTGRIRRIVQ